MTSCAFCAIASGNKHAPIVFADERILAFLDARPVFKGHVLVIPRAHYETLAEVPFDLVMPLFGLVQKISTVMPVALEVQGSFVGVNNTVGQSVPHLHIHVVPRSHGDGELRWTASLLSLVFGRLLWPRSRYSDAAEEADYAHRLAQALGNDHPRY
jgi:histidine triad (HIT) family protein